MDYFIEDAQRRIQETERQLNTEKNKSNRSNLEERLRYLKQLKEVLEAVKKDINCPEIVEEIE